MIAVPANVVIRPVGKDERAAWEPLWNGYLAFYKATLEPGASDVAWQRFHDPDEPMFLLGAYVDGKLTGIVQYLFHRSTWTPGNYCYLNDLFVTDGAPFVTNADKNPTLTIMALSWRASEYLIAQAKNGSL